MKKVLISAAIALTLTTAAQAQESIDCEFLGKYAGAVAFAYHYDPLIIDEHLKSDVTTENRKNIILNFLNTKMLLDTESYNGQAASFKKSLVKNVEDYYTNVVLVECEANGSIVIKPK
ncbi:hypothetical protein CXF85_19845 [Colwellia sp. 75C3]|uniref:hypothetical protein n=1 Tax=Colwellia sp. 75C3 TaxID=888425 RepID=UPI000C32CE27|nr:hypothetical protein [Colwellia sp. 75C3]PKG81018.1 hypothetical protein CXF85_19845 [Colwellia sp. 75C3]